WAIVQSAFCNSDDIIFCTTSSGRASPVPGIEDIVGPTFATFPVRITLNPQERVVDLLSRLQKQAAETIAFEHFGLQNIQRIPEIPAETLDLRNLFVVQPKLEPQELEAANGGMGLERVPLEEEGFHSYPLVLESFMHDGGVDFEASYDEKVLPENQMRNVLASLGHVVRRLVEASPDTPVGAIELVDEESRKQLMEWNNTTLTAGVHQCLHELVAQRIRENPSAPAICSWKWNLSYGQLGDLSIKLAARLQREYNVGPEVKVPFCLDKTPWAPVVAFAILMAGGVCVPLNPEHPDARLDGQLRSLKASLLLVSPWYVNRFQGRVAHTLAVDSELFDESPAPLAAVSGNATSSNAAFIVYTSGSTGTPKGIVLEHSALCTSAQAYGDAFDVGPGTRVLQFAAYTFDVTISDFFYALTRGACICVISESERMDDLMGSIARTEANYADLTSTVARLLDPVQIPTLKTLILAGEPLAPDVVSKFAGHANIINAYGPAECSVNAACRAGVSPEDEEILNYGRPTAAAFWVVNPKNHDQLYPLGA
ncbi:MAG: AMP-binding protein, partial [Terriglobus roseus]|nr:AMP-binding protein [Terriglobus roseus]